MCFALVAAWSCRILLGNSGDGGGEGDECSGDIIDSCDSGDFAGGFGGHDGLRVMKDFSENFSLEFLDAFKVSATLRILQYKGISYVGSIPSKLFYKDLSHFCTSFQRVTKFSAP